MSSRGHEGSATGLERLRRRAWWNVVGVIYLAGAFAIAPVVFGEPAVPTAAAAVLAAVGGLTASTRLVGSRLAPVTERGRAAGRGVSGRMVALAVTAAVVYVVAMLLIDRVDADASTSWADRRTTWFTIPGVVTGAVAVAAFQRRRVLVVAAGAAVAMALAGAAQFAFVGGVAWPWLAIEGGLTAGLGVAMVYGLHEWELTVRRDGFYKLQAQLAVADERLRFAADLHDVQGHHLQVIALKSELAARLAESDPSAAAAQMQEVQEHARAALVDTHEVVQGYRRTPLAEELTNATRVLDAAGIDGRVERGGAALAERIGEPGRQLLGLVVREATTNILRHSDARQARLALDVDGEEARLAIRNDGAPDGSGSAAGTGLATLAGRLEAAAGGLEWGCADGWFTVTARVPAAEQQPA